MMRFTLFPLLVGLMTAGCAKDTLQQLCVSEENTFDIEQVSNLEDAWGCRIHSEYILNNIFHP